MEGAITQCHYRHPTGRTLFTVEPPAVPVGHPCPLCKVPPPAFAQCNVCMYPIAVLPLSPFDDGIPSRFCFTVDSGLKSR